MHALPNAETFLTLQCTLAGNWGVHVVILKWAFTDIENTTTPYVPVTITGSSTLVNETMPVAAAVATAG